MINTTLYAISATNNRNRKHISNMWYEKINGNNILQSTKI